jgi:enoyl-CoA hydratase/carnithine racemase
VAIHGTNTNAFRLHALSQFGTGQKGKIDAFRLFYCGRLQAASLLRLQSADGTNRLTRACVLELTEAVCELAQENRPLVIAGNGKFFSAGADLAEIAALNSPAAYDFSQMGQALMLSMEQFPAPVFAAISGYCMGGGLDLALACHRRIAAPNAVFGHRGAALGLITGWGGTQRLPRLVGKSIALQMFVAAEKIDAQQACAIGLVEAMVEDPVAEALNRIRIAKIGL